MWQIDQAIYDRLTSDPNLADRVWNGVAPDDSREPFLVFQLVSGRDAWTHGARAAENLVYQVKAVGSPSRLEVDALYQTADALLNDALLSITSGQIVMLRRESVFGFTELDSGRQYWHSGGNYRVIYST
jgi:hypothetical protein